MILNGKLKLRSSTFLSDARAHTYATLILLYVRIISRRKAYIFFSDVLIFIIILYQGIGVFVTS